MGNHGPSAMIVIVSRRMHVFQALINLRWASSTEQSQQTKHLYATNTERKSSAHKRSKPVLGRLIGTTDEWTPYVSSIVPWCAGPSIDDEQNPKHRYARRYGCARGASNP